MRRLRDVRRVLHAPGVRQMSAELSALRLHPPPDNISLLRLFEWFAPYGTPGMPTRMEPYGNRTDVPNELSWHDPHFGQVRGADGYRVELAELGADTALIDRWEPTFGADWGTDIDVSLKYGTAYNWRLRGRNSWGQGPYTAWIRFDTKSR
jgi:hypothetical protein